MVTLQAVMRRFHSTVSLPRQYRILPWLISRYQLRGPVHAEELDWVFASKQYMLVGRLVVVSVDYNRNGL
jgi:hypothetical protein